MRQHATRSPIAIIGALAGALAVVTAVVLLADMRASAENADADVEHHQDFVNDTGVVASDLHIEYSAPVKVQVVGVSSGSCTTDPVVEDGGPLVGINWGEKCVESDGITFVSVNVLSKEPVEVLSYFWTNLGDPIGVTPGPTATPTDDITFPTLPPSTATDLPPPATIPVTTQIPPDDTATPTGGPPPVIPTNTATQTPTITPTLTPTATNTQAPVTPTQTPAVALGTGDVNCSSLVDSIDALLVLQLIAQLVPSLPCDLAADVNQNGVVDSIDVALILQFVANLIPNLPVVAVSP